MVTASHRLNRYACVNLRAAICDWHENMSMFPEERTLLLLPGMPKRHCQMAVMCGPRMRTCQASCSRRCFTSGDRCRAAAPPSGTRKGWGDGGGDAVEEISLLPPCLQSEQASQGNSDSRKAVKRTADQGEVQAERRAKAAQSPVRHEIASRIISRIGQLASPCAPLSFQCVKSNWIISTW